MKKISFAALALALALSAGLNRVSAHTFQADLLQLLPDGKFVVLADVQRVVRSNFWSTLAAENKIKKSLEEVQSELGKVGLRIEDLSALALVASPPGDPVVAISGSFNQSALVSNLRANPELKVLSEKYKGFEVYKVFDAKSHSISRNVAFVFYDSSTAVVGDLAGVRASIDVKTGARQSAAQNSKFSSVLAQNSTAAVRFAMEMTPGLSGRFKTDNMPLPDFASIRTIFGTLDFSSALDLNVTLRSESAAPAKAIADQLNSLLSMAKGFLGASSDPKTSAIGEMIKTLSITVEETDVHISGSFQAETISQLLR